MSLSGLGDLDDAALAAAIAEQEALVASNPAMAKYLATSLEQHRVERARRSTSATSTAMVVADEAGPAPVPPASPASGASTPEYYAYSGGELEEDPEEIARRLQVDGDPSSKRPVRSLRITIRRPERYGEPETGAHDTDAHLTAAERKRKRQKDAFYVQIRENHKKIKEAAREHACPLLCQQQGLPWPPTSDRLSVLLGTQMKKSAVASDGHYYDLTAITKYIQARMGERLVSPITKQPMAGKVFYVVRKSHAKDQTNVRWKEATWQPKIN
jgi:hypothetical protein